MFVRNTVSEEGLLALEVVPLLRGRDPAVQHDTTLFLGLLDLVTGDAAEVEEPLPPGRADRADAANICPLAKNALGHTEDF
jgi:pantothenate kinase-related protein Tda10